MNEAQARTLVGQRLLLAAAKSRYPQSAAVEEHTILEVSPSGEWIKLMNMYGQKSWLQTTVVTPVEVLEPREPRPRGKP